MNVEKQSVDVFDIYGEPLTQEKGIKMLKAIEKKGRTCYKSTDKITEDSYKKFLQGIIERGHESVIEHGVVSFYIVTNKAIETEIVRHRLSSYSISSTRYCNYSIDKFGNEITVIEPHQDIINNEELFSLWEDAMLESEMSYMSLAHSGMTPDKCRGVLPLDIKSEIWMTANLRQIRHFLDMRCDSHAHFQIRQIAFEMLVKLHECIPVIFDDLYERYVGDG